ncbi:MAG: hypothetical protein AAF604_16445 [Acidobacteriota bacterium]
MKIHDSNSLNRVRFASLYLRRLQGLRLVPFAVAFLLLVIAKALISTSVLTGWWLPASLVSVVYLPVALGVGAHLFYQRSLGLVDVSAQQRKLEGRPISFVFFFYLVGAGVKGIAAFTSWEGLAGLQNPVWFLVSAGTFLCLFWEWRWFGYMTLFVYYPVLGSLLGAFVLLSLPEIGLIPQEALGPLSALTLLAVGICDHLALKHVLNPKTVLGNFPTPPPGRRWSWSRSK